MSEQRDALAERVSGLLRDAGVGQIVRTDDHGGWDVRDVPDEVVARLIAEAKAEGWDRGHRVGWEHCQDGNYGNDWWDDDTPNPYRADSEADQ